MKVRYIGDPNDRFEGPAEIEQYGITFVKGEWVEVADDYRSGDVNAAAKFKGNHTFEVEGSDRPKVDVDSEADADDLRAALDAKGISYRKNANAAALRKLLAETVDNDVDGPELPPVPSK